MTKQSSERRKYVRVSTKNIMQAEKYSLRQFDLKKEMESVTKNLSAGGMLFESKRRFELGDTLKIQVRLPGWEKYKTEFLKPDRLSQSSPLVVLARVVRVEIVSPQRSYDTGVCFIGIDRDHQKALTKFINKKLQT